MVSFLPATYPLAAGLLVSSDSTHFSFSADGNPVLGLLLVHYSAWRWLFSSWRKLVR